MQRSWHAFHVIRFEVFIWANSSSVNPKAELSLLAVWDVASVGLGADGLIVVQPEEVKVSAAGRGTLNLSKIGAFFEDELTAGLRADSETLTVFGCILNFSFSDAVSGVELVPLF
jgi:hypothetical protein